MVDTRKGVLLTRTWSTAQLVAAPTENAPRSRERVGGAEYANSRRYVVEMVPPKQGDDQSEATSILSSVQNTVFYRVSDSSCSSKGSLVIPGPNPELQLDRRA